MRIRTKMYKPPGMLSTGLQLCVGSLVMLAGCDSARGPAPLPPGITFEVHAIAAPDAKNTIQLVDPNLGAPIALEMVPIVDSGDIATVELSKLEIDSANGNSDTVQPALNVELTPNGATKMSAGTQQLQGQTIAVVINGAIVSTPRVVVPIRGSFRITGDFNDQPFLDAIHTITDQNP